MNKFSSILNIVLRILATVVLLMVALLSIATAYIVLAPDTMPKPFYLQYYMPTVVPTSEATPTVTPSPTPLPIIDVKPGEGLMVNSGTKIVNLADPTGKKYIRVTVVLEFAPTNPNYLNMTAEEKTAYTTEFNTEVTAKMPLIDDTIITLLSTKTFDTLYTADGKENLRAEILERVNSRLEGSHVLAIYFTEFVVD
jgi:flagellar basal body-associated protein FliL